MLRTVTPGDYAELTQRVEGFARALTEAVTSGGLHAVVPTQGPLLGLYLATAPTAAPSNIAEARALCDNGLYAPFFHSMLEQGVALAPGSYEIMFVSMAHTDSDLARCVEAAHVAATVASKAVA